MGGRRIVWEAGAYLWKPDEIIADMFATDEKYRPVFLGIEEDGLHEFVMQPLRHAQVQRGHPLPLRPLKAPKGKFDFIRSLQPYFKAREVIFAGTLADFAELTEELLNFRPGYSGPIDAPNALAYFLKCRPGVPVYDGFGFEHIEEDIDVERAPVHLVLNTGHGYVTGVLCQYTRGSFRVIADYLREGEPAVVLADIVTQARLDSRGRGSQLRCTAPRVHFNEFDRIGLRAAASACGLALYRGGDAAKGRTVLSALITGRISSMPALRVAGGAAWVLRALQGGYARKLAKDGSLSKEAQDNIYSTLMISIESFIALTGGETTGDDSATRFDYTSDGRRFISARA